MDASLHPGIPPSREVIQRPEAPNIVLIPTVSAHAKELFDESHGDNKWIWHFMRYSPGSLEDFEKHFRNQESDHEAVCFTVTNKHTSKRLGQCTYMSVSAENGRVELGNIWYIPSAHRTFANTETIYLLLAHAFEDLKYRRVEWKCDNANEKSKAAALRLGFTHEGIFRQHMIIKGRNRDTWWASILDSEWLNVKKHLNAKMASYHHLLSSK